VLLLPKVPNAPYEDGHVWTHNRWESSEKYVEGQKETQNFDVGSP